MVAFQIFLSHVAFPERNAAVDDAVTSLLEDHDTLGIWLTDVVSGPPTPLPSWLDNVDDAHTTLCGKTGGPLHSMAT